MKDDYAFERQMSKETAEERRVRCDICTKSFPADQPLSTWVRVPFSDVSSEEIRDRCAACSAKFGPAIPFYGEYVEGIAFGQVPVETRPR